MKKTNPVALIILDGFGYSKEKKYNAIAHARMPHFNAWWNMYPHALLAASGKYVGLADGMIGNSEVGHLAIGAGRILDQPMKIWLDAIANNSFAQNKIMQNEFEKLVDVNGRLHIIGLLSDAGVHGHEKQIDAVIVAAIHAGIKKIIVHPILDGRDVAPQSAYAYLHRLEEVVKQYNHGYVTIGSIHGRFYTMDRDHHWDRIEKSYRVLTESTANGDHLYESWEKILERHYVHNITDEFITPTQLCADAIIHNGDGIIFCNVRPDRARQLTMCFVQSEKVPFIIKPLNLTFFITPIDYGDNIQTSVLFERNAVRNTLKDVLAEHGKTIFTIAETEKYAHVTYFFRGENEEPVATETRHMEHSLPAKNYVAYPEMRAQEITEVVVESLENNPADFYLINYANADMVGHSGNFGATIKAVEFLDKQLGVLYEEIVEKRNGTLYITADHGKAEDMFDESTNQPRTAHTNNKVPFLMIKNGTENGGQLGLKELADIAPFLLQNMRIAVPGEMQK
jgi:2,3-bisphosphoglycerate-independent phosphoglycerate mutase